MRAIKSTFAVACVAVCVLSSTAGATVTFFVHPDGLLNGTPAADPSRDLAFQAALTRPFTEFDFGQFGHEYIMEPSNLFAGVVRVRPNLLDVAGNNAADLTANGNRLVETWPFISPDIEGIIEGGPGMGVALLNRTYAGNAADVRAAAFEFTFSEPVEGFGAWIMDDTLEDGMYVLKITESNGVTTVSVPLNANNGLFLAIEGFLAAKSNVGITKAVIEQQTLSGVASNADFFYIDHVQVGGRFPAEICNNGVDDNADGAVDCADDECAGNTVCPEVCTDGVDNNGNALVDCADPECQNNPSFPACGETLCADGLDNDGDGQGDCADADCFGQTGCTSEALCADGLDNDADGKTDCADLNCSASVSCPETCDNGVDDNGNGRVDCNDPKCMSFPACAGTVLFFVEPDGQLNTADPSRDLVFQSALSEPPVEFSFADYGPGYVMEPSPLLAGTSVVRPILVDIAGNPAADLGVNGNRLIETYVLVPNIQGIIGGGSDGGALLNRTYAGNATDVVGAGVEFTFSEPVMAFGAWIMDDIVEPSGFVLQVTEVGGAVHTSTMLDSGNGVTLAIDGFIGAVSPVGITKAVIQQQTLAGVPSSVDFFYLDHIQVAATGGCNKPFADFDGDKDVDSADFGFLQRCYTGPEGTLTPECACADQSGDLHVDAQDIGLFALCANGPGIPADPSCDP